MIFSSNDKDGVLMKHTLILILCIFNFATTASAETIQIISYKTSEEIDSYYCKTTTGSEASLIQNPCSTPNYFPFELIYVPEKLGRAILAHLESARSQKYFHELSRSDFFHGHPLRSGATDSYSSPVEFFNSIEAMLYHSEEYTSYWYQQSFQEPDSLKRSPRSFYGWNKEEDLLSGVFPAVAILTPTSIPKQYDSSGTIYSEQVIEGLNNMFSSDLRYSNNVFIKTCETCQPCKVLDQIYILKDEKGRFLTKSQERVELFIQCKYLSGH
jgi:hypothetical protein